MTTHRARLSCAAFAVAWASVVATARALPTPTASESATNAESTATPGAPDRPAAQAVPASEPSPTTTEIPPAPDTPSAQELYDAAFHALARGEHELAESLLVELARLSDPLATRARDLLAALRAVPRSTDDAERPPPLPARRRVPGTHEPTGAARAELVFFQTVHGFALGVEACVIADCQDSRAWALSLLVGTGIGVGASWALSRDGVAPGLARATTDGTWWGLGNGALLLMATDAASYPNDQDVVTGTFLAGGQLMGLGLGTLAYHLWKPTAGQVSLTASGGLWMLVATGQALGIAQIGDERAAGWILLGAGNLGVLGGGWFAGEEPMTASRVLLIDAGGILGTLSGMAVSVLVQGGDEPQPEPTLAAGLAGTLLGLGLAYHLTAGWDDANDASSGPRLGLTPLPDGAQVTLSGAWH
jgi:hypothetical protein